MPKDHYVPVCYLRGFSIGFPDNASEKREDVRLFVYDIQKDKVGLKSANNLCYVSNLYTVHTKEGEEDRSVDEFFHETENLYSQFSLELYNQLYVNKQYSSSPFADFSKKTFLARFLFNQMKRVPKYYEKMRKKLPDFLKELPSDKQKEMLTVFMASMAERPAEEYQDAIFYLLRKKWTILVIADEKKSFLSSDAPVVLFNHEGIALDNTEISMPINSKIAIHLHSFDKWGDVVVASSNSKFNHEFIRELNIKYSLNAHSSFYGSSQELIKSIALDQRGIRQGANLRKYHIV